MRARKRIVPFPHGGCSLDHRSMRARTQIPHGGYFLNPHAMNAPAHGSCPSRMAADVETIIPCA
eukprot:5069037-Pyramimonas_sp.AAC.1